MEAFATSAEADSEGRQPLFRHRNLSRFQSYTLNNSAARHGNQKWDGNAALWRAWTTAWETSRRPSDSVLSDKITHRPSASPKALQRSGTN